MSPTAQDSQYLPSRSSAFMTPEQRRIFASKPIEQMRCFAGFLHWRGLQLDRVLFTADEVAKGKLPPSGIITYYMTTDLKFNLQINEWDKTPPFTHQATVKADRYGISNIGWHPFTLFEDVEKLKAEADRIRPWLDRKLYRDRQWRRKLKREHPEFLLLSRKRRRGGRQFLPAVPSSPDDRT